MWEDPFASWNKLGEEDQKIRLKRGFADVVRVLTNDASTNQQLNVLVLGVMVSGQPYAADKETRIRARFAVGSALGAGGYKPDTADHLGLVAHFWPSTEELENMGATENPKWQLAWFEDASRWADCCAVSETNELRLRIPFERYEPQEFFPKFKDSESVTQHYSRILLVWLDEEYFDDDPAVRLSFFKKEFERFVDNKDRIDWALIGPRTSSTLRSLLSSKQWATNAVFAASR